MDKTTGDRSITPRRNAARTRAIAAGVAGLAAALDRGDVEPVMVELEAAVAVCEEYDLPIEAARIRRWLGIETKGRA